MIRHKIVKLSNNVPIEKICDKCSKAVTDNDWVEWQEFYSIRFRGGFGSVFGDESWVSCDLCQDCLYEMIKDFARIGDDWLEEYIGDGLTKDER